MPALTPQLTSNENGKLLGKLSDAHNENVCQNNSTQISAIWHTPSPGDHGNLLFKFSN